MLETKRQRLWFALWCVWSALWLVAYGLGALMTAHGFKLDAFLFMSVVLPGAILGTYVGIRKIRSWISGGQ